MSRHRNDLPADVDQDLVRSFDPTEGALLVVPACQEALDSTAQSSHALEYTTANGLTLEHR